MQQLCLSGIHAAALADRLFAALNIRPVGLRIEPLVTNGALLGSTVHLQPPPAPPLLNGVPCRVRLTETQSVVVPEALEQAAQGLSAALCIQSPVLLSGLNADMMTVPGFRSAVRICLMSRHPVVVAADASARDVLQTLTPPEKQIWFSVPEDAAGQAALLERLLPEASLRF